MCSLLAVWSCCGCDHYFGRVCFVKQVPFVSYIYYIYISILYIYFILLLLICQVLKRLSSVAKRQKMNEETQGSKRKHKKKKKKRKELKRALTQMDVKIDLARSQATACLGVPYFLLPVHILHFRHGLNLIGLCCLSLP